MRIARWTLRLYHAWRHDVHIREVRRAAEFVVLGGEADDHNLTPWQKYWGIQMNLHEDLAKYHRDMLAHVKGLGR